ncbi:MAG: hypothetical protein JZU65_24190 [Chlorobium sp.]|nr:hypothetical protein [Chlorobium sp.]
MSTLFEHRPVSMAATFKLRPMTRQHTTSFFQLDVIKETEEIRGQPTIKASGILRDATNKKHTGEQRA